MTIDWHLMVAVGFVVLTQQMECWWQRLVWHCLVVVQADFLMLNLPFLALTMVLALACDVLAKNLTWLLANLEMSSLAGGEPAGAEQLCQLGDTCDVKLTDVASGKITQLFGLALESLCDIQ